MYTLKGCVVIFACDCVKLISYNLLDFHQAVFYKKGGHLSLVFLPSAKTEET